MRYVLVLLAGVAAYSTANAQEAIPPVEQAPVPQPTPVLSSSEPQAWMAPCEPETLANRWAFGAEYLLWWVKRAPSPGPYVTTTQVISEGLPPGSLSDPNTVTLIDDHDMNYGAFSGLRLRGNLYGGTLGLELSGFLLERRSAGGKVAGDEPVLPGDLAGFPFIAQPFFDVLTNQENAHFISVPTLATGSVNVSSQIKLFGYEVKLTRHLADSTNWRAAAFAGHRFLGLNENLNIHQRTRSLAIDPDDSVVFFLGEALEQDESNVVVDSFRATNRFYGGQIGFVSSWLACDCLEVCFRGSLAFGVNQQLVDIFGSTTLLPAPNSPDQIPIGANGGIFAQPTNMGRYFRNEFSFVPEGELSIQYHFAPRWTAKLGYDFLYWTSVVRPGKQIDRRLDTRRVPSDRNYDTNPDPLDPLVTLPSFTFHNSDFWTGGLTFGLQWIF